MFKKYRALLLPGILSAVEFCVIDTVHTLDWFLEAQNNVIDLNPRDELFECRGDLDEPSNPWDNDESDDPDDNLVLAQLTVPCAIIGYNNTTPNTGAASDWFIAHRTQELTKVT
jgi:hypothetical protein